MNDDMKNKSNEYWKKKLPQDRYEIIREKGTEIPFTNPNIGDGKEGTFNCFACGIPLFNSDAKINSFTGWPSFEDVLDSKNIELKEDTSHGLDRIEVNCKNCGAHLGHVFDVQETNTGKLYCINSKSLDFKQKDPR